MTFKSTIVLFTMALIFSGLNTFAQDTLNQVQIEVQGEYNATVADAVKIDYNPQIDPPTLNPPTLTYSVEGKAYKTKPEIVPGKAQGYSNKKTDRQYGNYTKLGYGMYKMPLFETYFHNTISKQMDYGIYAKHLSGQYDSAHQIFSDNTVKGHFGYHITPNQMFSVEAGYERNRNNFVQRTSPYVLNIDSTKNIYNYMHGAAFYERGAPSKDGFGFNGNLQYHFQNKQNANKENFISMGGSVQKSIRGHELNAPVQFSHLSFGSDSAAYKRLFIDVNPRYFLDYNRLKLNVGFNSTIFHDSADSRFYFYPVVDFKMVLVENKLMAHIGLDGSVKQNSYHSILKENMFVDSRLFGYSYANNTVFRDTASNLRHTNVKNRVYAGLWGSIGNHAMLSLEADFGNYMNMPMYLGDTSNVQKYYIVYDNVDILNVKATCQLQWAEDFKTVLEATYHNYKTDGQQYYWNMPDIDAKIHAVYTYNNMFTARLTAYYVGQRFAKNFEHADAFGARQDTAVTTLKPFVDVNLNLEYRYNKMIAVFVNAGNLTNAAYQRWNYYPSYRLNILGGVAFTF